MSEGMEPQEPVQPNLESQAPQEPTPQPAETQAALDLRQIGRDLGYTDADFADFQDDASLAQALYGFADEYGRMKPLAELGRKVAPYADKLSDFEKWVQEQDQPKPPEKPAEEGAPAFEWQVPEYDPAWESLSEQDDPLGTTRAKLQRYRQFQSDTLRKFATNPQELISKAVEPILHQREQAIQERIQQAVQEARDGIEQQRTEEAAKQEEQAWLRENMKELYALDGSGNVVYGRDNRPMLTQYGSQVFQAYNWARGLQGPEGKPLSVREASELAMLRVPKPQGAKPPEAPAREPERFLDTVSEAERHPERRPLDESAPVNQYPDLEKAFRNEALRGGKT